MLFGHLYVFFGELSKSSAHFLIGLFAFLMLNCISYLYILEINPFLISSYANICVYLHLFSISFIDVTLLFEWCQYSHLIILCQYFLNYSQTFFQPDEFHTTTSRELFHLEVTTVLTLKKNLTIAYISCGLLLLYVPLNSRITAVKEDIHALTGL